MRHPMPILPSITDEQVETISEIIKKSREGLSSPDRLFFKLPFHLPFHLLILGLEI